MNLSLEISALVWVSSPLAIAAIQDYKENKVSDLWWLMCIPGLLFLIVLGYVPPINFIMAGITVLLCVVGKLGQADVIGLPIMVLVAGPVALMVACGAAFVYIAIRRKEGAPMITAGFVGYALITLVSLI